MPNHKQSPALPGELLAAAARRLEDIKLLSLASSILAFGGLAATIATRTAGQPVAAVRVTGTPLQASPAPIDAPALSGTGTDLAPADAAPAAAAPAPPAPRPTIVSAQS